MKPSLGGELETRDVPFAVGSLANVRAQNARFQRRQKRRVLWKYSLLAFGRNRDHELGLTVEDDLRRRHELERDRVRPLAIR